MAMWEAWHAKCGEATPNKTTITGYTMLQADSIEAATTLLEGHPHFFMPGASVEILECVKIPGM
jgi:hypothetical protein